jgi:hypothetical protein
MKPSEQRQLLLDRLADKKGKELEQRHIGQLKKIYRDPSNYKRKLLVWCMAARGGAASLALLEEIRAELELETPTRQYRPEEDCEHIFEDPEDRELMRLPWPLLDYKSKLTFRQSVDEAIFDLKVRLGLIDYGSRNN